MIHFLVEIIFPVVFMIPGAYIRWLISGRKVKFREYFRLSNEYRNVAAGLAAVFLLIGVIHIISNLTDWK